MTISPYRFETQNKIGREGEKRLDAFFSRWFHILDVPQIMQDEGVDRIFWNLSDRGFSTIEYKTDKEAGRTGNAFVELIGDNVRNRPGWAVKSCAQWLAYLVADTGVCYVIQVRRLQSRLKQWETQYPIRTSDNHGRLGPYQGVGILVPLHEFQKIAERVYSV